MRAVADFLKALAKAFSVMTLYEDGHPAREGAVDRAYEQLVRLQEEDPRTRLTFLGSEVIHGDRPLREMKGWDWTPRLAAAGVQRLEFTGPVEKWDLEVFLDEIHRALMGESNSAEVRQSRPTNIRYGVVSLQGDDREERETEDHRPVTGTVSYTFGDEIDTLEWLQEELRTRGDLKILEAEAIVRSLSVAMHGDQAFMIPLLRLKEYDQYTTTHSLNVSTLAMALAEHVGLGPNEVRTFGVAGLLHDVGKVRIPSDILNKPGKLTPVERKVMNSHTVEGARFIMEAQEFLDLAAVVAYEHHIRIDGGGYPALHFHRSCHQASDLVHVCDVFDALRTDRPYRDAWPMEKVLRYMEEGAGTEFDPRYARAFVRMMREWGGRVAEVHAEDEELRPPQEGERGRSEDEPGVRGGAGITERSREVGGEESRARLRELDGDQDDGDGDELSLAEVGEYFSSGTDEPQAPEDA